MQAEAFLEGSILYIDGVEWGNDYTLDEAIDVVNEMQGIPNAPTGVRTFHRPTRYKKRNRRSQVGWPKELVEKVQQSNPTRTGWPD